MKHITQSNETDLLIVSVQGNYKHEGEILEEDHTPSNQLPSQPQFNPDIKSENNSHETDVGNEVRAEMFREIEASDPENITVMTSSLSLNF